MGDLTETQAMGWDGGSAGGGDDGGLRGAYSGISDPDLRRARLVRTIEAEIVPRLILTRRVRVGQRTESTDEDNREPDAADVKEFVRLLLMHDVSVSSAYIATVRERGVGLDDICLKLMAPAARELGFLWEQDECDFMQVTVGLCRLHQLLRELSPDFHVDEVPQTADRRVLLAPMPGEQHTFGITLVAQFLRRAGWDVWHEFPGSDADLLEIVRHNSFAVVGLSVGNDTRIEEVAAMISAIRAVSRNRAVAVLVGGPVLVAKPEMVRLVGADATAVDCQQAVMRAEYVCGTRKAAHRSGQS